MSANRPNSPPNPLRGEPNVAALLTLFVPGLGHLYAGRWVFGLVAFAIVEGLYYVGFKLSGGLVYAFLDPELRGMFAPFLTPEAGNLGALLVHQKAVGFGPETPVAWPEWIRLGGMLTALSGVANAVLACHAHVDARVTPEDRARRPAPAIYVALAWLVPGLGHFAQKRFLRGAIVFALLFGLFAWGTLLAEESNLSRERHFYYWAGQFFVGAPALGWELLRGDTRVDHEIVGADAGLLFACVAGLLNILAMLDVFGWSEAETFGRDPRAGAETAASAATGEGASA